MLAVIKNPLSKKKMLTPSVPIVGPCPYTLMYDLGRCSSGEMNPVCAYNTSNVAKNLRKPMLLMSGFNDCGARFLIVHAIITQ